ncbi:uncharacterized protein LOC127845315 isoform X2 [Dreissena polymorpha]|uniref:uncharacterized protein LOC127845315 isoform X2 n=2 Tax=Dreissena polymorpha TaxID=45954 RepID=UPI0022654A38|nr:uncharacterized protein LOC127845315 isoform X2 [Dreissena polymorpha]XP_052232112.1 uncharacterized protein LOC127845315 isoform X2 [Dreissena polymorpha]
MPYRPRRKKPFLLNSTLKDVLDRVFELCKLFEASDVHCFLMFVVKAAPDNVTSCGTKLLKKFLIDNPDIAKAFGRFCIQFNTATVVQKDSCNGEITSETADVNSSTSESQVEIKDEHNNIGDIEDERNGHAAQTCEKLTGNKQLQNGDNVECLLHNASLRCKLFEKNGMHGFVMFAKKSSPAEVICCGTSHGAKFLVDNPDIGKEFRTYWGFRLVIN